MESDDFSPLTMLLTINLIAIINVHVRYLEYVKVVHTFIDVWTQLCNNNLPYKCCKFNNAAQNSQESLTLRQDINNRTIASRSIYRQLLSKLHAQQLVKLH